MQYSSTDVQWNILFLDRIFEALRFLARSIPKSGVDDDGRLPRKRIQTDRLFFFRTDFFNPGFFVSAGI